MGKQWQCVEKSTQIADVCVRVRLLIFKIKEGCCVSCREVTCHCLKRPVGGGGCLKGQIVNQRKEKKRS